MRFQYSIHRIYCFEQFYSTSYIRPGFFPLKKALLNFDLGLISFYSGLIELLFVRQILFHTFAYTISDVELRHFFENLIPIRVVNNGFKGKSSYVEARFSGINQLYVVGRSLSDIDPNGMTI